MGMPGPVELLILFVLLLVVGIVVLVFLISGRKGSNSNGAGSEGQDARQLLDERYARGELGRDEYQQMREDIETE